jgi:glucose-6-phosphate 1-epimerase
MPALIEQVTFQGLPAVAMTSADGARAVVSLFGGQVLSWCPAHGEERLYLSDDARLDQSRAIRGGVPVCFPQFGTLGKLPRHGFARQSLWTLRDQRCADNYAMLTLALGSDERSMALWPHAFELELSVALEGQRLDIELEVTNTGHASFAFTAALHTYVRVKEVENARLEGLYGHSYRDANGGNDIIRDTGDCVVVDAPLDRIYHDVQRPLTLHDSGRGLHIASEGFPDVVVWNPWETGCAQIDDMPNSGFRRMLCIEAAAARRKIEADADQSWYGRQTLIAA